MLSPPTAPPDLLPLRLSHEVGEVDADLKRIVLDLFEGNLRDLERELNSYGVPHLGPFELIERIVNGDGLRLFRREDIGAMRYLFKAWKARNPRRGLIFLKTYLQLLWPNEWTCEQLWQRKDQPYPTALVRRSDITDPDPETNYWLTSRVTAQISSLDELGYGISKVADSLQATTAARLLLLVELLRNFGNTGDHALGMAMGGTHYVMHFFDNRL